MSTFTVDISPGPEVTVVAGGQSASTIEITPGVEQSATVGVSQPVDIEITPPAGPGPRGPQGPPGAEWLNGTPVEAPDGERTVFSTLEAYVPGHLLVFLNGLLERHISEISPTTFAFSDAPYADDEIATLYQTGDQT